MRGGLVVRVDAGRFEQAFRELYFSRSGKLYNPLYNNSNGFAKTLIQKSGGSGFDETSLGCVPSGLTEYFSSKSC